MDRTHDLHTQDDHDNHYINDAVVGYSFDRFIIINVKLNKNAKRHIVKHKPYF